MNFRPYVIEVTGNIVAREGKHCAQNWVCLSLLEFSEQNDLGEYDIKTHSITGDVILDYKMRAAPYAIYCAKKGTGIADTKCGADIVAAPGFYPAFFYFDEYVEQVEQQLEVPVDAEARDIYYNALYVKVFSILELFLSDVLLCGIFTNENSFEKTFDTLEIEKTSNQFIIENKIKNCVYHIVFHRFINVNKLFNSILGFNIPNSEKLEKQVYRRNNIVHRNALTNVDRMRVCNATCQDVQRLIDDAKQFVAEMRKICRVEC